MGYGREGFVWGLSSSLVVYVERKAEVVRICAWARVFNVFIAFKGAQPTPYPSPHIFRWIQYCEFPLPVMKLSLRFTVSTSDFSVPRQEPKKHKGIYGSRWVQCLPVQATAGDYTLGPDPRRLPLHWCTGWCPSTHTLCPSLTIILTSLDLLTTELDLCRAGGQASRFPVPSCTVKTRFSSLLGSIHVSERTKLI